MRLCILLACAALLAIVGFAPAPFPKPERRRQIDDMEAMLGMWKMVTYESRGTPVGTNYKIRIRKNAWTFINTQGQERESATYIFTLDTKLTPRAFEWKMTGSDYSYIGSYRLEARRRLEIVFGSGRMAQIETRERDFGGKPNLHMVLEYIGAE